jgi:hypothetical protein
VSARKLNNFRHTRNEATEVCELIEDNLFALVVNSLRLPRFARILRENQVFMQNFVV